MQNQNMDLGFVVSETAEKIDVEFYEHIEEQIAEMEKQNHDLTRDFPDQISSSVRELVPEPKEAPLQPPTSVDDENFMAKVTSSLDRLGVEEDELEKLKAMMDPAWQEERRKVILLEQGISSISNQILNIRAQAAIDRQRLRMKENELMNEIEINEKLLMLKRIEEKAMKITGELDELDQLEKVQKIVVEKTEVVQGRIIVTL